MNDLDQNQAPPKTEGRNTSEANTKASENLSNNFKTKIKSYWAQLVNHFKTLSIHRQSNVSVGVILFICMTFGDVFGDGFLQFVVLIFSLLLIFSGITGQYISHKILKKMPWNRKETK